MKNSSETKIKASTQGHLDIDDIVDDLVTLKSGWVALVLTVTAVNFDILSEAEQDATIYAYGALINSLSFPVQILIRSKKADITAYFHNLTEFAATLTNPDLKRQVGDYLEFLKSIVQQKTVLDKKFYLIIDFSPLEVKRGALGGSRQVSAGAQNKKQLLESAKYALAPKRDHLIKQLARLGLYARQLVTQELIELFYDIYNPAPTGTQRVIVETSSYTAPMVAPAVEVPSQVQPVADEELPSPSSLIPVPPQPKSQTIWPKQPSAGQAPLGSILPREETSVQPNITSDSLQGALSSLRQATQKANEFLASQPKVQTEENKT